MHGTVKNIPQVCDPWLMRDGGEDDKDIDTKWEEQEKCEDFLC